MDEKDVALELIEASDAYRAAKAKLAECEIRLMIAAGNARRMHEGLPLLTPRETIDEVASGK